MCFKVVNCFEKSKNYKNNFFHDLPNEIIIEILNFFYLPYKLEKINYFDNKYFFSKWNIQSNSFVNISLVNKRLNNIYNKPIFWKFIPKKDISSINQ